MDESALIRDAIRAAACQDTLDTMHRGWADKLIQADEACVAEGRSPDDQIRCAYAHYELGLTKIDLEWYDDADPAKVEQQNDVMDTRGPLQRSWQKAIMGRIWDTVSDRVKARVKRTTDGGEPTIYCYEVIEIAAEDGGLVVDPTLMREVLEKHLDLADHSSAW